MNRWISADFTLPAPERVKRAVLGRSGAPGSIWVETGTLHGDTTAALAEHAPHVHTIEPDAALAAAARNRFAGRDDITVHEGTSEDLLDPVLGSIEGAVSFWLDGHWSGDGTHLATQVTPILDELEVIAGHRVRLGPLAVLIDDVRLFGGSTSAQGGYPPLGRLLDWADAQGFLWSIEHDILILREAFSE